MLDFSPGPSVAWIRGWDRANLGSFPNMGLGFSFYCMQHGSRAETFLSLVLTESSHDQGMAQSEEAQKQLAPWGFGVACLQHLLLPLRFTCCHMQDKVENQLSGMQRMRDDEERDEGGKKQVEEYRRCL